MLAAVPAAKLAGSQADAITEGGEATASTTKMQERAFQFLHAAPARGARLLESRLAVQSRNNLHRLHRERTR